MRVGLTRQELWQFQSLKEHEGREIQKFKSSTCSADGKRSPSAVEPIDALLSSYREHASRFW